MLHLTFHQQNGYFSCKCLGYVGITSRFVSSHPDGKTERNILLSIILVLFYVSKHNKPLIIIKQALIVCCFSCPCASLQHEWGSVVRVLAPFWQKSGSICSLQFQTPPLGAPKYQRRGQMKIRSIGGRGSNVTSYIGDHNSGSAFFCFLTTLVTHMM